MNKLQNKYLHLLEVYRDEVSEANYPYSEKSGQYPEKHPFEDAPAEILDDEEFLLDCFEHDYAECFKFCSYRLRNKKDFVMQALKYAGPEYDQIGDNLKNDFDIIKSFKVKDFSKFGFDWGVYYQIEINRMNETSSNRLKGIAQSASLRIIY